MKPFTYERASSTVEAVSVAARVKGAKFIAGGTNLLDLMKLQIETPAHLIDVNDLALDKIEATPDGGLKIGALVRNTDLAADARVRRDYGVLSARYSPEHRASCATRRRRQETCCSARDVPTSTTPTSRATSDSRAAAVGLSAASAGSTLSSA